MVLHVESLCAGESVASIYGMIALARFLSRQRYPFSVHIPYTNSGWWYRLAEDLRKRVGLIFHRLPLGTLAPYPGVKLFPIRRKLNAIVHQKVRVVRYISS